MTTLLAVAFVAGVGTGVASYKFYLKKLYRISVRIRRIQRGGR